MEPAAEEAMRQGVVAQEVAEWAAYQQAPVLLTAIQAGEAW